MESFKEQFSNCCSHKNIFFVLAWVLIVFLAVLIVSGVVNIQNKIKEGKYIGQEIESKNTITVSDKAEIYAKPDLALIVFSVQTESKTVGQTLTDNTKKMNALIDSMKKSAVEEKDLKTVNFNIYPLYEYQKASAIYPSGRRVLTGYEVFQSLEVKIRNLEKIGELIEKAIQSGANQVGNLQFTIDKQEELKNQVRQEAIKKTRNKAEELAGQLGVNLVRITNFAESSYMPYWADYAAKGLGIGGGGEAPSPEIATGENKIEVSVTITYEIN